jgi:D-threonine aldolase
MRVRDLSTPALIVDIRAFTHNVETMKEARPGLSLRPHVKAFKSTSLARELASAGHTAFCAATPREILGMAAAGLGEDLLLANECLDRRHLEAMASCGARVTVAVDSEPAVLAAAQAGIQEVVVDVDVGSLRCGCLPEDAAHLAELARASGVGVRGVMGYEGHLMMEPELTKESRVSEAMMKLLTAHETVGGDVVTGGGTGTFDVNRWVTELQAGSYTLMDTAYATANLPFRQALSLLCTVISVHSGGGGWAVCDGGVKALSMDHGNPSIEGAVVLFCSDEHTTFIPEPDSTSNLPAVGDRVQLLPAHVDPTVAKHEYLNLVDGEQVVDRWAIDLRHW